MADVKISALPAASVAAATQLLAVVNDPSGTPVTQKLTLTQLYNLLLATANTFTADQSISTTLPQFLLNETDQAADTKLWGIRVSGSNFFIGPMTDAGVMNEYGLILQRSGANQAQVILGYDTSDPTLISGKIYAQAPYCDQSYDLQTPTTGFSLVCGTNVAGFILNPAGTLATGEITFPSSNADGRVFFVSSTQAITALTCTPNSGQTILNAPTTLAAGAGFAYLFKSSTGTWFRLHADPAIPTDRNTVTAASSSSGVLNLNWALGDYFTVALTENVTSLTFTNLPGSGKGTTIMVRITQDSSPRTFAWPGSFRWVGGTDGVISTGSGVIDVLALTTFDNGTTWDATLANAFAA